MKSTLHSNDLQSSFYRITNTTTAETTTIHALKIAPNVTGIKSSSFEVDAELKLAEPLTESNYIFYMI